MKITILDFDDIKNPLLNGGQARVTYELGSRFSALGHRVEVISSRYPGSVDRQELGIVYKHIGIGTKWLRLNNLVYIFALPFHVPHLKADVILECFTAPVSTMFTPLWTKIPVVAVPTSFEAERFFRRYGLPFHWVQNLGLRLYRYFLPYSEYFAQKMASVNPRCISRCVPLGVSAQFFAIRPQAPRHILFLGRMDIGQKGIDLLLQAYARIPQSSRLPLVLAGHGPDLGQVVRLVSRLKLSGQVKVVGPAYGRKKAILLSQAAFTVIPSRHEGFCLFALESLAAGVPVVSFNIPGLSWMDSSVSIKAKAGDVGSLSRSMVRAVSTSRNPDFRRRCRNFARSFTWDKVARMYLEFFTQIRQLSRRSTPARPLGTVLNRAKQIAYSALYAWDRLTARFRPHVLILCYHSLSGGNWKYGTSPAQFRSQIQVLLDQGYTPVTLSQVQSYFEKGNLLPHKSLVITFDDGYADIASLSGFLLRRGIKPALFVLSQPRVKNKPGIPAAARLLTLSQIKKLKNQGWEIGCHTATHQDLSRLDQAGLDREILRSKKQLEKQLGHKVSFFAYPHGQYSPAVVSAVAGAGFKLALTVDNARLTPTTSPLLVPRVGVERVSGVGEFLRYASASAVGLRKILAWTGIWRVMA